MDARQEQRYSRHIRLPQVGRTGQQRLLDARVLVIGLGGLGSPVALYLAAAGVGRLVLADFDRVEASNLQRQIVHGDDSVGMLKVDSARATLARLNPGVAVETVPGILDGDDLTAAVAAVDVVVDACDNFETRFAINRASIATATPLVSGAAMGWEGQVAVFDPRRPEGPCYHCLYRDDGSPGDTCERLGVAAPLLGVIGSLQAVEVMKLLVATGEPLAGRLLVYDALYGEVRTLRVPRDPGCPVCGGRVRHAALGDDPGYPS